MISTCRAPQAAPDAGGPEADPELACGTYCGFLVSCLADNDFASDLAVTVAEFARHIAAELPDGASERLARTVWRVPVSLTATLDLTDPTVVEAAGAPPIGEWILDREVTRATATYLLAQVPALQGLVVPSIAFLDRRDRPNLVVYRDRIDPSEVFGRPVRVRTIAIEAAGVEA